MSVYHVVMTHNHYRDEYGNEPTEKDFRDLKKIIEEGTEGDADVEEIRIYNNLYQPYEVVYIFEDGDNETVKVSAQVTHHKFAKGMRLIEVRGVVFQPDGLGGWKADLPKEHKLRLKQMSGQWVCLLYSPNITFVARGEGDTEDEAVGRMLTDFRQRRLNATIAIGAIETR